MKSNSTLTMTHEEWLQDRQKGIGGSDVATILGLNKWKSPFQLWLEKTGQVEIEETDSEPAYWGNVLEEVVAREFTERTGKKVRRRNHVFNHSLHPFLRANIDRDVVGESAILECKTANAFLAKEWEGEEIPMSYLCQVQHYMNVLNRDSAYVAVLVGGQKFIWKKIERDQELIDAITERLVEFWEENIQKMIEPPIDGSEATEKFLKERYSGKGTEEITLPSRFDELIESKTTLQKTKNELEEQIKQIENEIRNELGKKNAEIGISPRHVISWKLTSQSRLNKDLLSKKYPDIAKDEEIYKESESKRLSIKSIC
ncbi:YqaJ viral recombinase family protein [Enterococcus sp. AZ007]|uniref:YqaJ viral recombinase family nuclease n=1 Tax=Enterococcus sp. AZ007 TaxID=2774839 RepID=UPI003F1F7EC1